MLSVGEGIKSFISSHGTALTILPVIELHERCRACTNRDNHGDPSVKPLLSTKNSGYGLRMLL